MGNRVKGNRWSGVHRASEKLQGRRGVSVERMCRKVGMTRQNYYKQRRRRKRREVDESLIVSLVRRERQQQPRLGCRKIHRLLSKELKDAGIEAGRDRIFEVLRNHEMLVKPLPKAPRTTYSRHSLPVFRNLVAELETTGPNQIWVSDITYVWTLEGWHYLAVVMDLYSRHIVGWAMDKRMKNKLTLDALAMAYWRRKPPIGLLHHSDRGSQYACYDYQKRLRAYGMIPSMSRKGNCWDNAVAESFFHTLKTQLTHHARFRDKNEAELALFNYIEAYYNRRRRHSAIGYRTPAEFEQNVESLQGVA